MITEMKKHLCPRCLNFYQGYPATSRRDNETEICSGCGTQEAMIDHTKLDSIPKQFLVQERQFCDRIGADFKTWLQWKTELMAQSE